jgi:Rrf2 family protein
VGRLLEKFSEDAVGEGDGCSYPRDRNMHLSAKADYALRALVDLAEAYRGPDTEPVTIRVLAERNNVPKRFLEQIMIDLRACGWVKSLAGRDGGFVLAKPPHEITMGEIVRHFEGSFALVDSVSNANHQPCSQDKICRFREVLLDIRNYAVARLDERTLASIVPSQVVHQ